MTCVVCKHGELNTGATRISMALEGTVLVFEGVPANVCANCGEAYVNGAIAGELQAQLELARRDGITVEVRPYGVLS